jgi:hypothetical protein
MMTRRKKIVFGILLATCSIVSWRAGIEHGRGPAVRLVRVVPLGPGRAGGVLPLLVDGSLRDGCIPIVARSISRWVINKDGKLQLIKEPLTNVPLVAHDTPPPKAMLASYKVDPRKIVPLFLPTGIPRDDEFGLPVTPWMLSTDASPLSCGVLELLKGLMSSDVVGAHDIPIEILPPLPATPNNPAAAGDQVKKGPT